MVRWGRYRSQAWIGLLLGTVLLAMQPPCAVNAVPHRAPLFLPGDPHHAHAAPHAVLSKAAFLTLLGSGFLTGLSHCLGMCGPLVGAFAMRRRAARQELAAPLVLFQLGRLATYSIVGVMAGALGAVFATAVHAWQGVFAMGMGLLAVGMGLSLLGYLPLQKGLVKLMPLHIFHTWMTARMTSTHPAAPFMLGLANGFLPCGPVYAVAALAAMSADPFQGGSLMLLFGFGTLPFLLATGFSLAFVSMRLRQGLYRLAAMMVVGVGVQLTLRGLALHGYISHLAIGRVMLW